MAKATSSLAETPPQLPKDQVGMAKVADVRTKEEKVHLLWIPYEELVRLHIFWAGANNIELIYYIFV